MVGSHSSSTGGATAGRLGTKPGSCDGLLRLSIFNLIDGSVKDGETGATAGESKAGATAGASVEGCLFDGVFFVSGGGSCSTKPESSEPESEPEP